MKRKCKGVDITNRELVKRAVLECLRPAKKRQRGDTRRLFSQLLRVKPAVARQALMERGELYMRGVELLVDMLTERIRARKLELRPVYQKRRMDPSSRKVRKISVLSIEQLLLDRVAVAGLSELGRRIGEYQVSSIPQRGAHYGKRAVERWLRKSSCRYACKLDVRDFYGSIKRPLLLDWLHKHVKNRPLLWLVGQLLYMAPEGMAIGSYLSQTLANIYLSELYHLAMERCVSKRGVRQVSHALFYMDDMLLLGSNKRQLRYAAFRLMEQAGELGLQVKPSWQVWRVEVRHPVDMMGFRFSAYRTTLRKRVFKAARRVLLRAARKLERGGYMGLRCAFRLASYNGYTAATDCHMFLERVGARFLYNKAFKKISHGKGKIHKGAGAGADSEA